MSRLSASVAAAAVFFGAQVGFTADLESHFNLPAETLDKALRDFAIQAKCNISYEPALVAGLQAPAISGDYTRGSALSLLLKGTGLLAINVNEDSIQLEATMLSARRQTESEPKSDAPVSAELNGRRQDIREITVTGTHIRGQSDAPSPVSIYTRDDIDATGSTSIQQFLQTIPGNFGGGASENTVAGLTGSGQTSNFVNGSAPNLRGLGADATLVLVNGHRVAPGNSDGSFIDVSMIPLTAIERIEIVTDGASAIYGSDAVGGVVNLILRTQFDGAESHLQYGSVTKGAMHDVQAGQTVGEEWGSGSAVVSYQYSDQTPLGAGSRDYLSEVLLPTTVLPEQVEQAVFASVNQSVVAGWDLHGDLAYTHRATESIISFNALPGGGNYTQWLPARIDGYSASIGSTMKIARESQLAFAATYSESDTDTPTYEPPDVSVASAQLKTKAELLSVDGNLDGSVGVMPAGTIRYAVGGQFRQESFGNTYVIPATVNGFYPRRHVGAGYAELKIPLIGPSEASHGNPAVELTVADRAEHYSDFGSTNNPQVGVIGAVPGGFSLRATYGTSFKAPLLSELNPVPSQVVIIPGRYFNPGPGGNVDVLDIEGGNSNLRPEKARVWTAGVDFKPEWLPGFASSVTFYNIVFENEIVVAAGSICKCNAFVDASVIGPVVFQRNPSAALIQQLVSGPNYVNYFDGNPATVGAIFDDRSLNLSTAKTDGLDVKMGYKTEVSIGKIDTGIDGTYILKFNNQFATVSPVVSVLNTEFNPTKVKLRGRTIVSNRGFSLGAFINFTESYTNQAVMPYERVASWTTVDVVGSYQWARGSSALGGASITLSVINLADRDPPYLSIPTALGLDYDGANANAMGRYISLRLQKRW